MPNRRRLNKIGLRPGDRIRIIAIPGEGIPGYYLHPETRRAFKKLIVRKRSLRITNIDEWGLPWYSFRLRGRGGRWEWHSLNVAPGEVNWVKVKPRSKRRR